MSGFFNYENTKIGQMSEELRHLNERIREGEEFSGLDSDESIGEVLEMTEWLYRNLGGCNILLHQLSCLLEGDISFPEMQERITQEFKELEEFYKGEGDE